MHSFRQYHSFVCMLNMKLLLPGSYLSLALRLETEGKLVSLALSCQETTLNQFHTFVFARIKQQ